MIWSFYVRCYCPPQTQTFLSDISSLQGQRWGWGWGECLIFHKRFWSKCCLTWWSLLNILIKHKKVIRYWPLCELTFPGWSPAVCVNAWGSSSIFIRNNPYLKSLCVERKASLIFKSHFHSTIYLNNFSLWVALFPFCSTSWNLAQKTEHIFEGLDFVKPSQAGVLKLSFCCC